MVMDLRSPRTACLVNALGAAFALAAAWFFQLVVGLAPCPLCLDQRLPYYAAVPLALVLAVLAARGYHGIARAGLWLLAALMLVNVGLATYHAGIEWHFWQGPTACSGTAPVAVSDIMSALKTAHVPRCDEAAWRLLGISMAGWNALIALALAVVAIWGATAPKRA
ncbi:disulfide bond formation protein B [Aquabacter sp. CN5-332]|uniref:disulfide bond formation protein B n=1 Tax=Aquabacter sp. CN5-332 TaxID=3156608 RepID=UPI0032B48D1E